MIILLDEYPDGAKIAMRHQALLQGCMSFAPPVKPTGTPESSLPPRQFETSWGVLGRTGWMYNHYEVVTVSITNMAFQQYFKIAVSTALSVSALTLNAQNMRATSLDTNTSVTSLTNLKTPRHPAAPFGSIDASASAAVVLDVTVSPDPTSTEISNQLQSERGRERSSVAGSTSRRSGSPGTNLQGATSSALLAKTSPFQSSSVRPPASAQVQPSGQLQRSASAGAMQTPSGKSLLAPSYQSRLTAYSQSSQSLGGRFAHGHSAQSMQSPVTGNIPQNTSPLDQSPGSAAGGHFHRGYHGSGREARSAYRSLSDVPSEYAADASNVTPGGDKSNPAGTDRQEPQSLFESVKDPLSKNLDSTLENSDSRRDFEAICGSACLLAHAGVSRPGAADTQHASSLVVQSSGGDAQENVNRPRSRLQRLAGRLSEDTVLSDDDSLRSDNTLPSRSQSRVRPGSLKMNDRGSVHSTRPSEPVN